MVEKVLARMEMLRGFISIPRKSRHGLIGDAPTPFKTLLNGNPARVDKCGRIWSPYLKDRFPVGGLVKISKNEDGFHIYLAESVQEQIGKMQIYNKPFFNIDSISIYNDDFLETDAIKDDSIDLVVTSPPYNVDIKYENYNDKIPYSKYLEFTRQWLAKCYQHIKYDGRLCLNIPLDKFKDGHQSVYADITTIAKDIGLKYHSTIIWNEQNISRRTAWGSWLSASAPFVIAPVEVIVVLYKKRWKKTSGSRKSDVTRDEFINWTNGVWNFSGESKTKIGHPSPFPVELPKRCIRLFSFVGDTVLDPFLGSGTTLLACVECNRAGIGVEINRNYCELAVRRLKEQGIFQKKLVEVL